MEAFRPRQRELCPEKGNSRVLISKRRPPSTRETAEESTKHQNPSSREATNSKFQTRAVEAWCLVLLWSLELGIWSFLSPLVSIGNREKIVHCPRVTCPLSSALGFRK